jgi:FkbM family methyltransferase
MTKLFLSLLTVFTRVVGRERIKNLIAALAQAARLDLLLLAYNNMGILKYENSLVSGEHFLITKILKNNLAGIEQPIIFDVGANVGEYSLLLRREYPRAQIYAFEPNENTYKQLISKVGGSVICINAGIGSKEKSEKIYTYADNLASSHASIYGDVLSGFHKRDDLVEIDFQLTTLDLFCEREAVRGIDFLKIDTEGNEFEVLKGAGKLLSTHKIKIIQFEFGECDVFSRVFLRDFYAILSDYNIYRLDSNRLIALFEYISTNEIFRYQNFIAVRKDFPFQSVR